MWVSGVQVREGGPQGQEFWKARWSGRCPSYCGSFAHCQVFLSRLSYGRGLQFLLRPPWGRFLGCLGWQGLQGAR